MKLNKTQNTKVYFTLSALLIITNVIGQNLNDHKWQNRILIIQTTSETTDLYQEQLEELKDSETAFIDRKLVLYELVGNQVRMTDYNSDRTDRTWKTASKSISAKFKDNVAFKITLVGLDGGIKLQQTEVLKKNELFQTIDAMPMRKNELKVKSEDRKN